MTAAERAEHLRLARKAIDEGEYGVVPHHLLRADVALVGRSFLVLSSLLRGEPDQALVMLEELAHFAGMPLPPRRPELRLVQGGRS